MRLKKAIISAGTAVLLSTSLFAGNNYIGVKYGILSTNKSVYGNKNDTDQPLVLIKYDNVNLVGFEYQGIKNLDSNFLMFGMGIETMFNNGNFLEGGTATIDFKLGAHYKKFNMYGLLGAGLQSLSSYTVAVGTVYGIGVNYDVFKHMGAKIEYRSQNLKTTDNDELTSNQKYTLSGILVGISYKF